MLYECVSYPHQGTNINVTEANINHKKVNINNSNWLDVREGSLADLCIIFLEKYQWFMFHIVFLSVFFPGLVSSCLLSWLYPPVFFPGIPAVFSPYSLRVPAVFPPYSLRTPSVFPSYSLRIPFVLPPYSLRILSVFSPYSCRIPSVFSPYSCRSLRIPFVLPPYSLRTPSVFPPYFLRILSVFLPYSFVPYSLRIPGLVLPYSLRVHSWPCLLLSSWPSFLALSLPVFFLGLVSSCLLSWPCIRSVFSSASPALRAHSIFWPKVFVPAICSHFVLYWFSHSRMDVP